MYAFKLLDALISNNPLTNLSTYMTTIWSLLLHRMQEQMKETKTPRYCRLFIHSMSLFAALYGGDALYKALSTLEDGLVKMIILQIWEINRLNCATADPQEIKEMIIGGTKILCESEINQIPIVFGSLLKSIIVLLDDSIGAGHEDTEGLDEEADSREFDSAYSKLAYAGVTDVDPTDDIPSGPAYFAQTMSAFSRTRPGFLAQLVPTALNGTEIVVFQALLSKNGLTIE